MFRDITTLMQDGEAFLEACDELYLRYVDKKIDNNNRYLMPGDLFLALCWHINLELAFVPVRKKGKLPFKQL